MAFSIFTWNIIFSPAVIPTSRPVSEQMQAKLQVSELIVNVSRSIDMLTLNLVKHAQIGAPPTLAQIRGISIATAAFAPNVKNFTLELPNVTVTIRPAGNFATNGKLLILKNIL